MNVAMDPPMPTQSDPLEVVLNGLAAGLHEIEEHRDSLHAQACEYESSIQKLRDRIDELRDRIDELNRQRAGHLAAMEALQPHLERNQKMTPMPDSIGASPLRVPTYDAGPSPRA